MVHTFFRTLPFKVSMVVMGLMCLFSLFTVSVSAHSYTQTRPNDEIGPVMHNGGWLDPGGSMTSSNGGYKLTLQGSDGNVVLYNLNKHKAIWATGRRGTKLQLQPDGNLVELYGSTPIWAAGTWGYNTDRLVVQDDGNVVIYTGYSGGRAVWSSKTNGQ